MDEQRFPQTVKKIISSSAIIFIGFVESRGSSDSEPSTFCVMKIPNKSQAGTPSSFKMEVKHISQFRLPRLRRFLAWYVLH